MLLSGTVPVGDSLGSKFSPSLALGEQDRKGQVVPAGSRAESLPTALGRGVSWVCPTCWQEIPRLTPERLPWQDTPWGRALSAALLETGVFCALHVDCKAGRPKAIIQARSGSCQRSSDLHRHPRPPVPKDGRHRPSLRYRRGAPRGKAELNFPSLEPRLDLMTCLTKTTWWKRWSGS